jgi:hypothetical protein
MMSSIDAKKLMLGVGFAAISIWTSFEAQADNATKKTNINLAVASNFYGVPPSNSAIRMSSTHSKLKIPTTPSLS